MKCDLQDCPCQKSVQPITDVVDPRGKDWPGKTPPRKRKEPTGHGSWLISRLDDATKKRLVRHYPRIRRLIPKEKP